jgi:hypothetical protein
MKKMEIRIIPRTEIGKRALSLRDVSYILYILIAALLVRKTITSNDVHNIKMNMYIIQEIVLY